MKTKKFKLIICGFLGLFLLVMVFLSIPNSVEARSIICKKYDDYRIKYNNDEDRAWYFKTSWLKNHEHESYDYYKSVYNTNKVLSASEFGKLSLVIKNIFSQYHGYVGYNKYLIYKHKCYDGNDNSSSDDDLNSDKKIISFSLPLGEGGSAVEGTIDEEEHTIDFSPVCANLTVAPTIEISAGATIDPESGVEQDFNDPVVYTVTAEDGSTQEYTVTVPANAC